MSLMAQHTIRRSAILCCAMGLALGGAQASLAAPLVASFEDVNNTDDSWLVDDDFIAPLIASGVMSKAQAQQLMTSYNVDTRIRASILLSYQSRAELAVARAHGMSIDEYESTPVRKLPKLSKVQKGKLNAQLTTLARDLRLAMSTSATTTSTAKKPLKVVPPKPRR